jgi:hypothetical protein
VQSVRSLFVAGSLLLSAVAAAPAQQPSPAPAPPPGAHSRRFVRPQRQKQYNRSLLRGVTLNDAEKANVQAVRAKYATQLQALRAHGRTQAQSARAARQRGDTTAFRAIRANVVSQRQALLQAEQNDLRNALTPANQAKFDANLKAVESRGARQTFRARRLTKP